jgi:hypothetical protein
MSLPVHPAAEVFPLMQGDEYAALVEDIRANGLREPGKMVDGKLIDGRNRERACADAGVDFVTVAVDLNGDDPIAYVASLNVKRRNLSAGQRAIAAAEAWDQVGEGSRADPRARKLARLFGTNDNYVSQARALVKNAPDLAQRVKEGTPLSEGYGDHQKRRGKNKTTRDALVRLRAEHPDLADGVDGEALALRDALAQAEQRDAETKQRRWAATMNVLDALAHFDRDPDDEQAALEASLLDESAAASRGQALTPERLRRASAWASLLADQLERRKE